MGFRCVHCDYDLAGVARDFAGDCVCPECGGRTSEGEAALDLLGRLAAVRGFAGYFAVLMGGPSAAWLVVRGVGHVSSWVEDSGWLQSWLAVPLGALSLVFWLLGPLWMSEWIGRKLFAQKRRRLRRALITALLVGHIPATALGIWAMFWLIVL